MAERLSLKQEARVRFLYGLQKLWSVGSGQWIVTVYYPLPTVHCSSTAVSSTVERQSHTLEIWVRFPNGLLLGCVRQPPLAHPIWADG